MNLNSAMSHLLFYNESNLKAFFRCALLRKQNVPCSLTIINEKINIPLGKSSIDQYETNTHGRKIKRLFNKRLIPFWTRSSKYLASSGFFLVNFLLCCVLAFVLNFIFSFFLSFRSVLTGNFSCWVNQTKSSTFYLQNALPRYFRCFGFTLHQSFNTEVTEIRHLHNYLIR